MKFRVGVEPLQDQSNENFKLQRRPRTKWFSNEENANSYYAECKELAKRNCYRAFFTTVVLPKKEYNK